MHFDREFTFGWDELLSKVIEEKYRHIADYFSGNEERGMAFIYKLLELLAERDDRITKARWVYFLTRMRNPPVTQRLFSSLLTGYTNGSKIRQTPSNSRPRCTSTSIALARRSPE